MLHGADALLERGGDTEGRTGARAGWSVGPRDAALIRARNRIAGPIQDEDRLIRQLAADRLRELRDDGMTLAYVARMYGVGPERMEALFQELLPSPPR